MILIERFVKFSYYLLLWCAFEYFIEKAQYKKKMLLLLLLYRYFLEKHMVYFRHTMELPTNSCIQCTRTCMVYKGEQMKNLHTSTTNLAWENSWHCHDTTTGFPIKWHLRNECRNSILMTHPYPDLGCASDWSCHIGK